MTFAVLVAFLATACVLSFSSWLLSANTAEAEVAEGVMPSPSDQIGASVASGIDSPRNAADSGANVDAVTQSWAEGIAAAGKVFVNGEPLSAEQAKAIAAAQDNYCESVEYIDQKAILPSGCEIVALSVAMKAEGYEVAPTDIADRYVKKGKNVATDYLGDARSNGGGLPPCIVDASNAWLQDNGQAAKAYNLTGTSFDGLLQLVNMGYPVVVWTTEQLAEPSFVRESRDGLQWYVSEHCVVLYGAQGGEVLVSNSLEGLKRYDREQFAHIYEACGNKAMFVA